MTLSFLFEKNIFRVIAGEIKWNPICIELENMKKIIDTVPSYINIMTSGSLIKIINTKYYIVYEYNLETGKVKKYNLKTETDLLSDYTLIEQNNEKYILDYQMSSRLTSPAGGMGLGYTRDNYITVHFLLMKYYNGKIITAFSDDWVSEDISDFNLANEENLFNNYKNINYYQYIDTDSQFYIINLKFEKETKTLRGKLKGIKDLFIVLQKEGLVLVNSLSFENPLYFPKKYFLNFIEKYVEFEDEIPKVSEKYNLEIYPEGNYWEKINYNKDDWFKLKHTQIKIKTLEKIYSSKFIKGNITEDMFCVIWNNYNHFDKCLKKLGNNYYLDEGPLSLYKINLEKEEENYKLEIKDTIFMDSWISDPRKAHDVFTPYPFFDTSESLFYHPLQKLYYIFTRCNLKSSVRSIVMSKSKDLKNWSDFEIINIKDFNFICGNYYVPGIQYYPESNLMSSINYYIEENKHGKNHNSYLQFLYTKDGINCNYFNISLASQHYDVHDNQINPIFNSIFNYNNKTYFMLSKTITKKKEDKTNHKIKQIYIKSIPKNRWNGLKIDEETEIITGKIKDSVDKLMLNYKIKENGFIKICILDSYENIISDYENMKEISGDKIDELIEFKNNIKIENGYKLKIKMKNCELYTINILFDEIKSEELFNTIEFWYHEYYPQTVNDMKMIQLNVEKNGLRAKKLMSNIKYNHNSSKASIDILYENDKIKEMVLYDTTSIKRESLIMCLERNTSTFYNIGKIESVLKYIKVRKTVYNVLKKNKLKNLNKKILEEYKEILDFCKDKKNIKEIKNKEKGVPAKVFNCTLINKK